MALIIEILGVTLKRKTVLGQQLDSRKSARGLLVSDSDIPAYQDPSSSSYPQNVVIYTNIMFQISEASFREEYHSGPGSQMRGIVSSPELKVSM